MKGAAKAKIFLSTERGCTQTERFRRFTTFNFGLYQNEHKEAFDSLYVWNDETLAGGESIQLIVEEDSRIVLLPVVGAIEFNDGQGNQHLLQAGQSLYCTVTINTTIMFRNPYPEVLVNFLHGWFKGPAKVNQSFAEVTSFDLDASKNKLVPLSEKGLGLCSAIGKFDGRIEGKFLIEKTDSVFVFVVQGAFEVQNRLLETGDGLALWSVQDVEFEALSNEAILLIFEPDV